MVLVTFKIYINFVTFSIFREDPYCEVTLGHSPGHTLFVTSSKGTPIKREGLSCLWVHPMTPLLGGTASLCCKCRHVPTMRQLHSQTNQTDLFNSSLTKLLSKYKFIKFISTYLMGFLFTV